MVSAVKVALLSVVEHVTYYVSYNLVVDMSWTLCVIKLRQVIGQMAEVIWEVSLHFSDSVNDI